MRQTCFHSVVFTVIVSTFFILEKSLTTSRIEFVKKEVGISFLRSFL